MKAFIVHQSSGWADDRHAMLVREDGRVLADHLCSHPMYMYGDLWGNRKERQEHNPDLEVEKQPHEIEAFKISHPEIFHKAFRELTPEEQAERGIVG